MQERKSILSIFIVIIFNGAAILTNFGLFVPQAIQTLVTALLITASIVLISLINIKKDTDKFKYY